jgi:hypothetical protein
VGRLTWAVPDVETQNAPNITVASDSKAIDVTIEVPLTNFNSTKQAPRPFFVRKPGKRW